VKNVGVRISITTLDGELIGQTTVESKCYDDWREMVRDARVEAGALVGIELTGLLIRSGIPPAEIL
jgi:hypothetical protein